MTKLATIFLLLLPMMAMVGCNTLGDAKRARGEGMVRSYDAPFDEVWAAVPRAAQDLDLSVAGTYREDRYILLERGTTMFSWGERVAVFVDPITDVRTQVEVVSKRAVAVNITATNFQRDLLDAIGDYLAR